MSNLVNNLSKFSVHKGVVDVNIIKDNVSVYLLNLIANGIYNFEVKYMDSEQKLKDYQQNTSLIQKNIFQSSLEGVTIAGYNKTFLPLTISRVSGNGGIVQLIDDKLIYFPRGISLVNHRDSYLYNTGTDKIYTSINNLNLLKELVALGYDLFLKEGNNPANSDFGMYNLNIQKKPVDLKKITLDSIDITLFD